MIARVWKGTPRDGRVGDYLAHLRDTVVPELDRIPGFCGVEVLAPRAASTGGEKAVVVITKWDSMESVARFAGTDPSVAVVAEPARRVLAQWDEHVTHYDLVDFTGL